ncbi:MAG: CocE/NonD family hydrolase, partial [Candidatus Competibacteraceae bacterium]
VFETPPLDEDVTIAGDVAVTLFVSSDRPTTDFTAKLVDVHPPGPDYPEGFAMNLTDGILRASFRNGFSRPEPLSPGEVAELTIRLYPTANRFLAGHRIRLEVSSSNFPRFDVNPNFAPGEDLSPVRLPAINRVHLGPDQPSRLLLHRLTADR